MVIIISLFLQGPVQDDVIAKLRIAFLEIAKEYKVYTEEERKQVSLHPLDFYLDFSDHWYCSFLYFHVTAGCVSWWTSCGGNGTSRITQN